MDKTTAYEWAAQCLKPVLGLLEPHKWKQVRERVAVALIEASKGRFGYCPHHKEGILS